MRDHPVPQRAEFGGRTAQVQRPRVARRLWIVGVVLLGFLLASAPMPARAASVLSNGSVSPGSGTTATAFSFSVDYNSSNPVRNALSVWAEAGGVTVPLALVAGGNTHAGTWRASSSLPVGSWQVTFHATTSADPQPVPIDGPIVTVTLPPPTPTPGTDAATDAETNASTDGCADANSSARRDAAPSAAAPGKHAAPIGAWAAADVTAG